MNWKLNKIVIVDIDGTISKVGERIKYLQQKPKDWDSFYKDCFKDEPIWPIIELVSALYERHIGDDSLYEIVFCTGRREQCREKTIAWFNNIHKYSFAECRILMRKDNDLRHDIEVKPELLRDAGIKFDDIAFVIEDRNMMVKKWRELGLICIQPFDGDF